MSLSGFLLLFVASRLVYLALIEPGSLLIHPGDELYIGTIAQELVTGLAMPFTEYRQTNYALGTLVIGALGAGFFLLFGPTVFALKLAPLFLSTLALVFWYWTIRRAAGKRVAGYFAMLFCFSPPLFTAYSVATLGTHSESIVFSALTVFLLFRMLSVGAGGVSAGPPPAVEEKPSPAYPLLLGLTAGFGLWFAYIYGLTLLALLGFWFWHDTGGLRQPRALWFALGFTVGFSPWIVMNLQTHFAGLTIYGTTVVEHFGLAYLLDDLAHPRTLAPVEFLRTIASDDSRDLYRRAVNLLYSLFFLGPILTAGVLRLKTGRSAPAGARLTKPTLVGFSILYLVVFILALQFSDFRAIWYHVPVYPFLFFFAAHALAYCQDRFPRVQRQIKTVFLASVVVLGLGTHATLLSLDRPGAALSAKGYTYAPLPETYFYTHAPAGLDDRAFILEMVQRPFLSDILPKLSADDQQEISLALVGMLAGAVPLNGQTEDFARIERLVPPGFERHFYYLWGEAAMFRHSNELPQAVAGVEFVSHRSAAAHHLALVGIYRVWPRLAALDSSPESLANSPIPVAPALAPHYWRALGYFAGRYWYDTDRSLSRLNAHLQQFIPQLDPSVHRYVLQGVGELIFDQLVYTPWVAPAELDRFPHAYQEGLLEGWGVALGDDALFSPFPWTGHGSRSLLWIAATKGFSARNVSYIQQGKAQFEALFEAAAPRGLTPPLRQ